MIKAYVFIFLTISSLYLISTASFNVTDVFFDKKLDIIFHGGKLYLPKNHPHLPTPITPSSKTPNHPNPVHHEEELVSGETFWIYLFIIICKLFNLILVLTCFAGLMSGLTVGYLSIDDLVLELRFNNGTDEEKEHAAKLFPILDKRHWLLVTLLLMNAFCMEALPLFLDKIVPEYMAILISVVLVLLFGEIIPQAICTGPDQVKIAARVAPLTKALMWMTYPISYPIAKLLDSILGEHHKSRFLNNDLKSLIELHTFNALEKLHDEKFELQGDKSNAKMGLNEDQANIMISALELKQKKVINFMIPIRKVFMIDFDDVLDEKKLKIIMDNGYSRIPVFSNHNKNDIVGLLRIKQLIGIDFKQKRSLRQHGIELRRPIVISPNVPIVDLLREFRKGKSHMALITEQVEDLQNKFGLDKRNSYKNSFSKEFLYSEEIEMTNIVVGGIITMEDIIEKMINLDILDEDDYDKEKILRMKKKPMVTQKIGTNRKKTTKEIAKSFIREESLKLDSILKENFTKKKSLKDNFIENPYDSAHNSYKKFNLV